MVLRPDDCSSVRHLLEEVLLSRKGACDCHRPGARNCIESCLRRERARQVHQVRYTSSSDNGNKNDNDNNSCIATVKIAKATATATTAAITTTRNDDDNKHRNLQA